MVIVEVLKSIRPLQWSKNFFIFGPLLFSENILVVPLILKTCLAFGVFCLISGSIYIFNDLMDLEEDRKHPEKSKRPLAAGRLKKNQGAIAFVILSIFGFAAAFLINKYFVYIILFYYLIQIWYCLRLKHVVILDVFIISIGFIIRVAAGALAIKVQISPWLLICSMLLALFLALSKRRYELSLFAEDAGQHRPILKEYSLGLLDQMISIVTASTVIAYCLYTISSDTVTKFGTNELIYTVPFVLYGIFRYLYLVHQRSEGGSPEMLILKDKPLLLVILLWTLTSFLIIYVRG